MPSEKANQVCWPRSDTTRAAGHAHEWAIIIAVTIVSIFAGDRSRRRRRSGMVSRILGEANDARRRHTGTQHQHVRHSQRDGIDRDSGAAGGHLQRQHAGDARRERQAHTRSVRLQPDLRAQKDQVQGCRFLIKRILYRLVGISSVCNAASGCENFLLCVCNAANEIIRWGTIEMINGKAIERIKPRVKGARSDTPIAFRIQLVPNASRTRLRSTVICTRSRPFSFKLFVKVGIMACL